MKLKVLTCFLLSLLISGTVAASSNWGQYKGNEIVKLIANGKETSQEVPAHIEDGKTMVPLTVVRDLGFEVTWEGSTYTVSVTKPTPLTDAQKAEIVKNIGVVYVHNKNDTWSQGTGFMTDSGAFLTAFHVIDEGGTIGDIRVDLNGKSYNVTDVAYKDKGKDVAELKFTSDVKGLKVQKTPWLDGQNVSAVGYPHEKFAWIDGVSVATEYGIYHTAFIDSGGSGSPLLNISGEVVAVNIGGVDDLKTGYSTSILEFINELH